MSSRLLDSSSWPKACRTSPSCTSTPTCCPANSSQPRPWPNTPKAILPGASHRSSKAPSPKRASNCPPSGRWSRSVYTQQVGRNQLRNPRRNQHSFHQALRAGRRRPGSQPPPLRRVTSIPDKVPLNRIVEQFFRLACLDFHRFNPAMTFEDVHIKYLFPYPNVAFGPNHAARRGFTHLIADAKADANIARRLELRTQCDDHGSRPRTHPPPNRPACAHTSAG